MAKVPHDPETQGAEIGGKRLTSSQTAKYTQDMLDSLKEIAARQDQDMLVRLLEVAAIEAGRLVVPDATAPR